MIIENTNIYEIENDAAAYCDGLGIDSAIEFLNENVDQEKIEAAFKKASIFSKDEILKSYQEYVDQYASEFSLKDTNELFKKYNKISSSNFDYFKKVGNERYNGVTQTAFHRVIYSLDFV